MGAHQKGIPLLIDATHVLSDYLEAERGLGRMKAGTDVPALALTLTGTGHLLCVRTRSCSDEAAIREIVESIAYPTEPEKAAPNQKHDRGDCSAAKSAPS